MNIGKIELRIENVTQEQTLKYQEILTALVASGGLNLKGGRAIIHFDFEGVFQGIELNYYAFKRKADETKKRFDFIH